MKKKIFELCALIGFSLCFSNFAIANGWYNNFKISQLQYSRGADGVLVVFSGGTGNPNPDGCDHSDRFLVAYTSANPMREKVMLSGITTAYAMGKNATVLLSGCVAGIGNSTYPVVWYFYEM